MWSRIKIVMVISLLAAQSRAQQVRYSSYFHELSPVSFQVAAKAGEFYWVEKEKLNRGGTQGISQRFEVYDSHMNIVRKIVDNGLPEATIKQYLIGNTISFDKLTLCAKDHFTRLFLKRYSADGAAELPLKIIDSLPLNEDGKSFIFLRSPGGKRFQLLAFETKPDFSLRLHTILFDADWNIIRRSAIENKNITQPCIQDDLISFPIEDFNNEPIKLADNGEWTMSTPSRTSNGFLFFHGCDDGTFSFHEIRPAAGFQMEDVSLTLDPKNSGASVAILSGYRNTSLKKLQVAHYSMTAGCFDFDSTYFFNTLVQGLKNKTLVRETLSGLPQGGYIFCKEYGREADNGAEADTSNLLSDSSMMKPSLAGDTRYRTGLQALRKDNSRGDLQVFYFPSTRQDSTWTAVIREPQTTEMNCPSLSYLVLPAADKLMFVYNSSTGYSNYPATAAVDHKGNPTSDALVFWKFSRTLNFQQGRRITGDEVAVPYEDRPGFAIIRL